MRCAHDDTSTRQAFTNIIIGIAYEIQGNSVRQECRKTLACCAIELNVNRVVWQTSMAITLGDFTGEHCTNRTVHVLHGNNKGHFLTAL